MKKLAAFLTAGLLCLSLTGCSSDKSQDNSNASSPEHYIGFSAMTLSDAALVQTSDKLKAVCDKNGWKYEAQGAEGVAATQVSQIENMVTMGCDIILITPLDYDAIHDVMKDANEKGVHCVYIGDPYEGEEPFAVCVNIDQKESGRMAAQAAAEWIEKNYTEAADGSIEVALFQNSAGYAFVDRADGLREIEKLCSKAKIVETYDLVGQTNATAMCQEYTDELLMKHPDVKVILSHSSDYGNAIDEVIMRTASVDPASMGIFAVDYLSTAADAIRSSVDGQSAFRAFVATGDSASALIDAGLGNADINEAGQYMLPQYVFTAENMDEADEIYK